MKIQRRNQKFTELFSTGGRTPTAIRKIQRLSEKHFSSTEDGGDFRRKYSDERKKDEEVKRDFRGGIQRGIQRRYLYETGFGI